MDIRRRLERLEQAINDALNQANACDLCRGFATAILWQAGSGEQFVEVNKNRITENLRCAKCGMEANRIVLVVPGTTIEYFNRAGLTKFASAA
jgi:hypothetical protein